MSRGYSYVLYIDEAGDDSVRSLRPEDPNGNSEWLCLGGYLIRAEHEVDMAGRVRGLLDAVGARDASVLHFRKLSRKNRETVASVLGSTPARAFAICSCKKTMVGHHNERAARSSGTNQYLYNFVVRYLLERVTAFVEADAKVKRPEHDAVKIVLSRRKGHRFGQFKAYVQLLIRQATADATWLKARQVKPGHLFLDLIDLGLPEADPGCQLADVIASAFFQALETAGPHQSPEPAFALRRIMAREWHRAARRMTSANFGVTLIPEPERVVLRPAQQMLFERFGY